MTKERVESIRKIVLPFITKKLKEIDYEGLGESDAKEFTKDFNEILNLAEDALEQEPKSEWEHDHEILKAYSDGASAVLESLIEQYEHYLELLDADMKDGSATIVTKTKYAVYAEVVEQLKEVEVQE